jgi:hypothetical protein
VVDPLFVLVLAVSVLVAYLVRRRRLFERLHADPGVTSGDPATTTCLDILTLFLQKLITLFDTVTKSL